MSTEIAHDAFARETLVRDIVRNDNGNKACDWCGSRPKRLFAYRYKRDDSTWRALRKRGKMFCGVGCFRDYHG